MTRQKLAPGLVSLLEDFETDGPLGATAHLRSLGVIPTRGGHYEPRALAFVHCQSEANLGHLNTVGVEINQTEGSVRTAIIPLSCLDAVASADDVDFIEPSRPARPCLDLASTAVSVAVLKATTGGNGASVLIGIVDTGIDPTLTVPGTPFSGRVLQVWDQTLPGLGVPRFPYGRELKPPFPGTTDDDGHGTHVAGIAAGMHPVYGGVANGASLVIVKTDMQTAHIADAIQYLTREARLLGKPIVINLSLGQHADAHDGSDSLSRVIDSCSGPGVIVCCAAGNEGHDDIHGQVAVAPGAVGTFQVRVPPNLIGKARINGWYPGNAAVEVAVRSPRAFSTPFQAPIRGAGSPSQSYAHPDGRVRVITPGPSPLNGDHNFEISLLGSTAGLAVRGGTWEIQVKNTSAVPVIVDAWTLDDQQSPAVVFRGAAVQDALKIGSPGCSKEAITVASYTTRVSWTAPGPPPTLQSVQLAPHDISAFSSEGPLRSNGAHPPILKPDVAAPGAMIASTHSSGAPFDPTMLIGTGYRLEAGTSMATPFVCGVVALLLDNPHSVGLPAAPTPADIKTYLQARAWLPPGTGHSAGQPVGGKLHDPKWGFGLLKF